MENLLASLAPKDEHLQEADHSTIEEMILDPSEPNEHKIHLPSPPRPLTRNNIFGNPEAHALVLNLLMLEHFEHAWLDFEPEAVVDEITTLFGEMHPLNFDKVMACQMCFTKEAPWDEWHYFVLVNQAFNGIPVDTQEYRPPTAIELAVTVNTLNTLDTKTSWSPEVLTFIEKALEFEQFFVAPPPLDQMDLQLSKPGFSVNYEEIKRLVASGKIDESGDTIEQVQAARLLDVKKALADWRNALALQLRVVKRG